MICSSSLSFVVASLNAGCDERLFSPRLGSRNKLAQLHHNNFININILGYGYQDRSCIARSYATMSKLDCLRSLVTAKSMNLTCAEHVVHLASTMLPEPRYHQYNHDFHQLYISDNIVMILYRLL
jgi:hypothetical protein